MHGLYMFIPWSFGIWFLLVVSGPLFTMSVVKQILRSICMLYACDLILRVDLSIYRGVVLRSIKTACLQL